MFENLILCGNQQQRPPKGRNVQRLNVLYLMNYIVYKTTNIINGKVYIGVHYTNPDIFDGYIGCGVTKKDKKKKVKKGLPAAVRKYGYENFKRETLFIFPDTEEGRNAAYDKEAEIVDEKWVKSNKNYNIAIGGIGGVSNDFKKKIAQYTLDGVFIRSWSSITEAEKTLGLQAIGQNLIGKSKYAGDFQWKYYIDENPIPAVKKKEKTVYQFDMQGNLLKVWKSTSEAAKMFSNYGSAKTTIHECCKGERKQGFGYYWSFKNKFEYRPKLEILAVARYTDDGIFVESYSSITEAAEIFKCSRSGIYAAISGKNKHCKGWRWRYFYGNTQNIKPLK